MAAIEQGSKRKRRKIVRSFIIDNGNLIGNEIHSYFPSTKNVTTLRLKSGNKIVLTMYDILVYANFYPTREAAKKAWTKTDSNVPVGFSRFTKFGNPTRELVIYMPTVKTGDGR